MRMRVYAYARIWVYAYTYIQILYPPDRESHAIPVRWQTVYAQKSRDRRLQALLGSRRDVYLFTGTPNDPVGRFGRARAALQQLRKLP
jgi:hypothetical protein